MKSLYQVLLLFTLLTAAAFALSSLSEKFSIVSFCDISSARAAETQTVELPVEGMTCAACTFAVKTVLKRLDGVHEVKVSYGERKAVVVYDPQQVTPEQMAEAVNATGSYQVVLPANR
jgi:copper chaperone CopZ